MNACLILRGHHFYEKKIGERNTSEERMANSPEKFDFRDCFPSLKRNIIDVLGNNVDCYITTYESQINHELFNFVEGIKNISYLSEKKCSQMHTFYHAIKDVPCKYDVYVICRFDLLYKNLLTKFLHLEEEEEAIYCTWKETQHLWNGHNRIGDALFVVKGKESFKIFKDSLIDYIDLNNTETTKTAKNGEIFYPSRSAHYFYPFLEKNGATIKFLVDGFFDTNTSFPRQDCNNPIYVMYGRNYYFDDIREYL